MRIHLLTALSLLAITAATAAKAEECMYVLPPSGTSVVSLAATERLKLNQDTLNATLRIEQENTDPRALQDAINKAMTEALAEANKATTVKTSTTSYYVYQYDEQNPDPNTGRPTKAVKKWRGSQSIQLESKEPTRLLELAGKIQDMGFVMGGLDYSLSNEQSDKVQNELLDKALRQLGAKAKIAQAALGKSAYEIVDVSVEGAQPPQPVMYKAMAMRAEMASDASVASPAAQSGETEVTLTVTARALLK